VPEFSTILCNLNQLCNTGIIFSTIL